jgi:uncharacterized membrane protein
VVEPSARDPASAARWHRRAVVLVAGLAVFEAFWELSFAPLRPGGSWLALKALASLLLPLFAAEGIVRALSEPGRHALAATVATGLALAAAIAVLLSFVAERKAGSPDA